MPLGNLTSQFFANVYLNELDQYVKHILKAKYYVRYVDDFVILGNYPEDLQILRDKIETFCGKHLALYLHPDKSKIHNLKNGVGFLGMRLYPHHNRIKKKNIQRFERKLLQLKVDSEDGKVTREKVVEHFEGWLAYIFNANTFKYRKHLVRQFNQLFPIKSGEEIKNVAKHQNFIKTSEESNLRFSVQKTLSLWRKGKSIEEIAQERHIKKGTVWQHLSNLIEYNQLSVWKVLLPNKLRLVLQRIVSEDDKLRDIKKRINNEPVSFDEINCVLAYVKSKNRIKNITFHVNWYKNIHCLRKCYLNKKQRKECSAKFDMFITKNPHLKMKREDFLDFFNNHLTICVLPEKEKRGYISWKQFKVIQSYLSKKRTKVIEKKPPHSLISC